MAELPAKAGATVGSASLGMSTFTAAPTTIQSQVLPQLGGTNGIRTFITEITTNATSGEVTFATYFGSLALNKMTAVMRVTAIQQDALGTAVSATSWTAAGVATWTTTLTNAKNYYIVFECI